MGISADRMRGMFLREPPHESDTWGLADWRRWIYIDALYRAELAVYQQGLEELNTRGFTGLPVFPGMEPTWEDSERVYDRATAEEGGAP